MRYTLLVFAIATVGCASMPASRAGLKETHISESLDLNELRATLARVEVKLDELREALATGRVQDREGQREDLERLIEMLKPRPQAELIVPQTITPILMLRDEPPLRKGETVYAQHNEAWALILAGAATRLPR